MSTEKEILKYKQTRVYDSSNNYFYQVSQDILGPQQVLTNTTNFSISNDELLNVPYVVTTGLHTTHVNPLTFNDGSNYYTYIPEDTTKKVSRKEIVETTKMSLIKQILDQFEQCEDMIDIQKLVLGLNEEYKRLAEQED